MRNRKIVRWRLGSENTMDPVKIVIELNRSVEIREGTSGIRGWK